MRRRKFSREFKLEAVRLVKDRGAAVAQVRLPIPRFAPASGPHLPVR
ncbi:MAG: transposase [Mesorhizobium sp.]|nr:MAG: transposase [Mesorhizobium sp.]